MEKLILKNPLDISCFPGQSRAVFDLSEEFRNLGMGDKGRTEQLLCGSSHGAKQTCSFCGSATKNWILFHSSQILSQQMTARHRNKIKHHIKEILNPAANNWLHFSRYWLLSRSCLGKAAESWFMTAHRNKGSSNPCSGNVSILPLKFSHELWCFIP